MRKGLRAPKTYDEAKTRIENALFQIKSMEFVADYDQFDLHTAYRVPSKSLMPWMVASELQAERERAKHLLSERVHRIYLRTRRIAIVCDLIRHSPVFLREEWVNDLILELKKTVLHDPQVKRRKVALDELSQLSRALISVRLPSGEWRRKAKWKQLSADRPDRSLLWEVTLLGRYSQYLEIATCLKQIRPLMSARLPRGSPTTMQPPPIEGLARDLRVDATWLRTCWAGNAKPYLWATARMADDLRISHRYVQRRLAQARKIVGENLKAIRLVREASGRLAQDRKEKAIERSRRGESSFHRRY